MDILTESVRVVVLSFVAWCFIKGILETRGRLRLFQIFYLFLGVIFVYYWLELAFNSISRNPGVLLLLNMLLMAGFSSLYSAWHPVNRAIRAAEVGDLQGVKTYLAKGGNANAVEFSTIGFITKGLADLFALKRTDARPRGAGVTALHCAASKGHTEIVRLLIRQGADVNRADQNGLSALHWVAMHSTTGAATLETAQLLLSNGANPNAKATAQNNCTPLHEAAAQGKLELVELLIQKGAEVNLKMAGDPMQTPLRLALENNHKEVADLLIRNEANINPTDMFHATLLHWAATAGLTDAVTFLLSRGAAIDWRDGVGNTPLHLAAQSGHKPVVELLVECGAEVDATTNHGSTPLNLALHANQLEIVKLLESYRNT